MLFLAYLFSCVPCPSWEMHREEALMDMLVKLYELQEAPPSEIDGIRIRRAMGFDRKLVLSWIKEHFSQGWKDECGIAFTRQPVTCFVASKGGHMIGFSAYDVTAKGVFGPMGVAEDCRTGGIGKALLLAALHDMRAQGYAYAVIGWTGPAGFYEKCAGAKIIEGSQPQTGMYSGLLRHDPV